MTMLSKTRTRFQPFDLRVTHGVVHDIQSSQSVGGFYDRRRKEIEALLTKFEDISSQDLCHSISSRIETQRCVAHVFSKTSFSARTLNKSRR